jgi:hypothetical protein
MIIGEEREDEHSASALPSLLGPNEGYKVWVSRVSCLPESILLIRVAFLLHGMVDYEERSNC